ncbi:DUF1489 domain-containing protein [Acidocella sp.]|uniref:DUF1489 family protein n=1 Tax=Acidocella sp. TaxID=50710 RepID=UPI003441D080
MAVGVRDIAHLHALQTARAGLNPPFSAAPDAPRHFTRQFPKRAAELVEGGSIYWVIGGVVLVRQLVLDVRAETETDGTKITALVLDPTLVPVEPVPRRAFQGWRYLRPEDAPRDLGQNSGESEMPEAMRRELAALGLL